MAFLGVRDVIVLNRSKNCCKILRWHAWDKRLTGSSYFQTTEHFPHR
jgi:hypothetical protein